LLGKNRQKISVSEIPWYQELDSGIIELAYIVWAFPKIAEKSGINIKQKCTSLDDLEKKYKIFDLSSPYKNQEGKPNSTRRKLRGIHAVEMCLKIDDDVTDPNIDDLLGIPNLLSWDGDLKALRNRYLEIAREAGIPDVVSYLARFASHVRGMIKDKKAVDGIIPTDDLSQTCEYTSGDRRFGIDDSALRHQLKASGLLNKLFGR
jgi:hypothetical protein